jgi:hypothetical protein
VREHTGEDLDRHEPQDQRQRRPHAAAGRGRTVQRTVCVPNVKVWALKATHP